MANDTPSVIMVVFEPRGTLDYEDPRLMSWEVFLERGRECQAAAKAPDWFEAKVKGLDPEAPSMIVYTSGTTGQPKGAMRLSENAPLSPTAW